MRFDIGDRVIVKTNLGTEIGTVLRSYSGRNATYDIKLESGIELSGIPTAKSLSKGMGFIDKMLSKKKLVD
jgi:hypothetical protein